MVEQTWSEHTFYSDVWGSCGSEYSEAAMQDFFRGQWIWTLDWGKS
jgi:hypothetical protein